MFFSKRKGVSVYLVIMIGAFSLAIVLGLSSLLIRQAVIVNRLSESVLAFYGADSGIERILYAVRQESYDPSSCLPTPCKTSYPQVTDPPFTNGVSYEVYVQETATSTKLRSLGIYRQTKRGIEISY